MDFIGLYDESVKPDSVIVRHFGFGRDVPPHDMLHFVGMTFIEDGHHYHVAVTPDQATRIVDMLTNVIRSWAHATSEGWLV